MAVPYRPPFARAGPLVDVYRDEYVAVLAESDGLIVRVVRTQALHPSPAAMEASYAQVAAALDRLGRRNRALLVDMREAVGRNDPTYEPVLRRARLRNDAGFQRIGVLLRTTIGMMQMRRFAEEEGIVRLLSMDEAEVLDYLRTGFAPYGLTETPKSGLKLRKKR